MNIFFDLDGTLLNNTVRQCFLLKAHMMTHGETIDTTRLWRAKREGSSNRTVLAELGLNAHLIDEVCAAWVRDIETPYWLSLDTPIIGAKNALDELPRSHRLELLTARRSRHNLHAQILSNGLSRHFSRVRVVDPFRVVEGKAAVLVDEAADVFIGDSETDFMAAKEAGVMFIGVSSGQRSEAFLRASGVTSVFNDLSNAIRVALKK